MTPRLIIQPRAWRDISEICDFLGTHYPASTVEAWYEGCIQAIQSLATNPERCQIAREALKLDVDLRQLLYRRYRSIYRILFVIRDGAVRVVCVRHAARDEMRSEDLPAEDRP
jgi:plasmid stabilization system protein ParE